jgi:twitching motility protein PilT
MARLDPLLRELAKHQAGTLVLEPGCKPQLNHDGGVREISSTVLQSPQIAALIKETAPLESADQFRYQLDGQVFDFNVTQGNGACRAEISQPTAAAIIESAPPVESASSTEPAKLPEISELLDALITRSGSDLHLSSKQRPRMRVQGDLLELKRYLPPKSDELKERLWKITPERNRKEFEEKHDTDFAVELPGQARFRVNLFEDRAGIGAVFRQIPFEIPTFEQLGLPEVLRSLAHLTKGLVLVTGPTGSGKSTTLAALVDLVNESRPDHIITIEDPIEFVHTSKRSLIHQREPGVHTLSFAQALRAALREDPDVLLVGEMRDLETIAIAIETAETGHLVMGTLHTSTAPSTVERIVDQFPSDRQEQIRMMLAESLRAVVSQTLLKKIDGGRIAAFEILICTPAVANLIREGKTFQIASAMQTGRQVGMMTQTDSLYELVIKKVVTPEEAYLKAVDKEALVKKLQADGIKVK